MPVATLQDLTVVECATFVTGPYAAALLDNLGTLMARQKSGVGCRIETFLLQATLSLIGETAAGYLRTGNVPNRVARVKNGDLQARGITRAAP